MHRLLKRQLDEHLADEDARRSRGLEAFLRAVAAEYARADRDRTRLEQLDLAVRGARDGLWDWHLSLDRAFFSERCCELVGLTPAELDSAGAWLALIHEDDREEVRRELAAHIEGRTSALEVEYRMRHANGSVRWMLTRGLALYDEQGQAYRIAGSQTDITQRKEEEGWLRRHAYHDEATGYPNRLLLLDRLRRAVARRAARDKAFAVVAVGIDAFDKIADSFGHDLCERVVKRVADRVAALASPIDTLARIRKDQLCLLIEAAPHLRNVLSLTDRIQDELQRPMQVDDEEVFTTVSIGIVSSEGAARGPEDYLHEAVVALHRAADGGGGRRAVFDLMMHQEAVRRLQLEKELRRATANGEFCVHYQPIVSLEDGAVAGFEALLRWNHPERGLLSPHAFIDVAEETGHLSMIFEQVFPDILERAVLWQARSRNGAPPFINVNLSRTQFRDPDLLRTIDRALSKAGALAPHTIGFEMTESVMVDDVEVAAMLRNLKKRDVRLLLDDFGTGYSCLSNLHQFPLDSLKIDKAFVAEVGRKPQAGEIARAIATLAHSMALDVTIEGIETEAQLRFAYSLGCDYAQGYYFATPMPADEAGKLLGQGYRTSLTPPSSAKRPRKPQTSGRVLLVDSDHALKARLARELEREALEVVHAVHGHEGFAKAEGDLPDVILVAVDLPGMGCVELCRRLRRSDETALIPILLLVRGSTTDAIIDDCLDAGATDCVAHDTSTRVLLARLRSHISLSSAHKRLRTMAMTDELTGVFTRQFLFQALRRSVKATVRQAPRGLACLVIDADDFKHVNETRGHIEADALLRGIARTIDGTTRETDLVARFGGAEFVVLLQDTDEDGAKRAAEKIRAAVERDCDTTVSIGGACLHDASIEKVRSARSVDDLISQLLRDADAAKYAAKSLGKNRVVFEVPPADRSA